MTNTKRAFSLLALAGLLSAGTLHAEGGEKNPNGHKPGNASTAEIVYAGKLQGQPVFNVIYKNPLGSRFTISVFDEQGQQLFASTYFDKAFDRKFSLSDDAASNGKLLFVVRNYADHSVQQFEVSTGTRVIEDIEVKEVK